ncbi:MAG: TIGR03619 family F420-dependent LLM class oxidoreductase [Acidimicrobiia bacterium]
MHIGLERPAVPPYPTPDIDAAAIAVEGEKLGFESLYYGEHPIRPVDQPGLSVHGDGVPFFQDTLVGISRASAATTRMTVGGSVFLIPQHNPVQFAKELACLDYYSKGRLVVGAGIGWSKIECEVMGGRWYRRWAQTRETVMLMKRLWTEETVEHHGPIYDIPPVQLYPKPATPGGPPVLLGGSDAAQPHKLFRRIVDYADGWMPAFYLNEHQQAGPDVLAAGRILLHQMCTEAGRDPSAMRIDVIIRGLNRQAADGGDDAGFEGLDKTLLRRYEDAGADRVLVTIPTLHDESDIRPTLEQLAERVL